MFDLDEDETARRRMEDLGFSSLPRESKPADRGRPRALGFLDATIARLERERTAASRGPEPKAAEVICSPVPTVPAPEPPATLGDLLLMPYARHVYEALRDAPRSMLTELLRRDIGYYDTVDPATLVRLRVYRFVIHRIFMERGIAPGFRGDLPLRYERLRKGGPAEQFFWDGQILDLLWRHHQGSTHVVVVPGVRECHDLLAPGPFDYAKAERFAKHGDWFEKKVIHLGAGREVQLEHMVLRQKSVASRAKELCSERDRVELELLDACKNPRRGCKVDPADAASRWADCWWSFALARGSPQLAAEFYRLITGEVRTRGQMAKQRGRIDAALEDVGSTRGRRMHP